LSGFEEAVLRLGLIEAAVRRSAVLIGSVAVVLAAAVPASAYQPRWSFYPAWSAQPGPDARAEAAKRRAAKPKHKAGDAKVKATEKIPPGPQHIIISIKQQRLTLYANGEPVAHSPVSTGVPGHPTPLGVFSIIQKNRHHRSNIYSSAPMPFMQRITWSGVALHEGKLPGYPASHGCIRLPGAFAQRLWGITRLGVRVIIAQDDVALADINHARLFAPKPAAVSEAPATVEKIRFATASFSDAPLKGSIDANDDARIESAIDKAAQDGIAEIEAYLADDDSTADAMIKLGLGESAKDPMLRPGPISVYISRKTARLYVRKGFVEVFETPVTIAQPDRPLGTHVFTALNGKDGMRWNVASLPTERVVKKGKYVTTYVRGEKLRKELVPPQHEVMPPGDPNEALDRITIPDQALARITELTTPGASLIVSDLAYSYETGNGTDFIVLTR
jgi:lipoprotein-anchoring transpeptidase ErfK/SrfK